MGWSPNQPGYLVYLEIRSAGTREESCEVCFCCLRFHVSFCKQSQAYSPYKAQQVQHGKKHTTTCHPFPCFIGKGGRVTLPHPHCMSAACRQLPLSAPSYSVCLTSYAEYYYMSSYPGHMRRCMRLGIIMRVLTTCL
jgi:hypothetical protein